MLGEEGKDPSESELRRDLAEHARDHTAAASEHYQRRISRSHMRLLMTLKAPATVRELAISETQVDIAMRQVDQQVVAPEIVP